MAVAVRLAVLLLAVAVLHVGVAAAQSGGCQCDGPPCLEVPQRTPTGFECIKVPRSDCPCCLVCGHQEGEQCDDLSQPCDLSSRLFCNTTSGLCQKKRSPVRLTTGSYTNRGTPLMTKPAKADVRALTPAILFVNPSIVPQVSSEEDSWQVIHYVKKDPHLNIKTNAVF